MHAPVLTRLAALLAPVLISSVLLSGCNETTPAAQASPKKSLSIGIVQIVEHEALDDAVKGFVERLDELGYREGVEVTLDRQNAQGDQATLAAITGRFVSNDVDLIYAVSTPAVQAAARATRTIPIVATAVTSFERAKVVKTNEHHERQEGSGRPLQPRRRQFALPGRGPARARQGIGRHGARNGGDERERHSAGGGVASRQWRGSGFRPTT